MVQTVKNPSAIWETWVQSLGWEYPLEEGMATHFGILAWRIPTDRGTWWATVHGVAELDMTERLSTAQHKADEQCCDNFRWTAKTVIHIHLSTLPQTPLPRRLPQNMEQSSLCHTVRPCWLPILKRAVYTCPSHTL